MISGLSSYLPEQRLTNEDLARAFGNWTAEKIFLKTGIRERRIAGKDECASDMAVAAAERLLGTDTGKVDFLIFCSQAPDYILPTTACLIQKRLGLKTSCGAIDLPLGCSGYVYGLSIAHGLIAAGTANEVLLLTADTYSKLIGAGDKSTRTLFGDGATATLLSRTSARKLSAFTLGTDGGGQKQLIVERGGSRVPLQEGQTPTLYMNGPEIFNFTNKIVPPLLDAVLLKADLKRDDISFFVFHQANGFILEHLRAKMGIETEKLPLCLSDYGNTVSSTIPLTLAQLEREGRLKAGMKLVLIGFGVGFSWGGCVLEW